MTLAIAALFLIGLVIGITVHEFAHAWSASLLGDDFPRRQGRVSLNPFRHLSLVGTLAVFVLRFGWGKPVMINAYNFKRPKRDFLISSLAGPAANIVVVGICFGLMLLTRHCYWLGRAAVVWISLAHGVLLFIAVVSTILAVINLIPIPPLDGSKIWPLIIPGLKPAFGGRTTMIFVVVLVTLIWTGSLSPVIRTAVATVVGLLPESDADVVDSRIESARDALQRGQFAEAERLFSQALAVNPNEKRGHFGLALVRFLQTDRDRALDAVNRALELDPDMAEGYWLRARVLIGLGRFEEAAQDLGAFELVRYASTPAQVSAISELASDAFGSEAWSAYEAGEYVRSERLYSEALEFDAASADLYYGRACARYPQGNHTAALADVDRAIALDNTMADYRIFRGDLLEALGTDAYKAGRYPEAERLYTEALEVDPEMARRYHARGCARSWQQNWHGALEDANRAIELDDREPTYFDLRAASLERLGRADEAQRDRQTAETLRKERDSQSRPAPTSPPETPQPIRD